MSTRMELSLLITPRDGALIAEIRPLSRRETSTRLLALATVGLHTQNARGADLWLPSAQTLGLRVHSEQRPLRKRLRMPSTDPVARALAHLPAGMSPSHVFIAWCRLGLWTERQWIAGAQVTPAVRGEDHRVETALEAPGDAQKLDKETQASMLGMLQKGLTL